MKSHISRTLRKNETPHESKFWYNLRNRELGDLKSRRQYKIGKYIADFCCPSKKLVIELDGGHHVEPKHMAKNKEKQEYIESQGYKVLRV